MTQAAGRPKSQTGRCAICGKEATPEYRPFCSKRCADVDLQRWLSGRYAIPVVEEDQGIDQEPDEPTRER